MSYSAEASYEKYLADLRGGKMARSVRQAALFVIVLNLGFIPLDVWVQPREVPQLVGVRLLWSVLVAGVYFLPRWFPALVAAKLGCVITGLSLIGVSGIAGGLSSSYWPAIMILFLGMPVLLPLTPRDAGSVVGALTVAFAGLPLVTGESVSSTTYAVPVFFVAAAAVECVASCFVLDRMRFADFQQRLEIEKARDELEEMDRVKSRFTANVHHELRTPLTLMLAPLESVRAGDFGVVPEAIDRMLRTMQVNGLRLLKLINNLLDLAKVESEQLEVRRVSVDVGRLLDEVAEGARPMAERKGLSLEVERRDPGRIFADPEALEKVLVNLLGNALKFTEEGGIRLAVELAPEGGVHVEVADTGVGIPEAQLERVFDRFAQVDSSATRSHEGTGIGLSLVRELVQLHGGRVWAESGGPNPGTRMHVWLPVGKADAAGDEEVLVDERSGRALSAESSFQALASETGLDLEAGAEGRFATLEQSVGRWESRRHEASEGLEDLPRHGPDTPEVVIAEDNPEMRRLLAFLVGREFRVRPCRNGREALEAVQTRPPALVVTDVMMPGMSGTELCRALKSDPATRGIPVMLVTSKAEREMKIEGLELGADDYVTKPFHPRELLARVRSLVRVRRLQRELDEQNASLEASNRELEQALCELKEAEVRLVQAERLAAVGELSAGVAHEVNNPLNFARNALSTLRTYAGDLQGVLQTIAELDLSGAEGLKAQLEELERKKGELGFDQMADDLNELVGIVTEGLDRTSRLVADLRDFAAPQRGGRAWVDVAAGLRSTLELLGHRLRAAGARVELDLPSDLPRVAGDASALNQVFLNLLKNAAEAIEGQGGTVRVEARAREDGIVVHIRDDGPGMDSDVISRLFEPFFTTKQAGKGTGLGLSICRRIVEDHGGAIAVESAPGAGTCVTVRLPREGTRSGGVAAGA